MGNELINLKILGVTFSQVQAGAYAMILAEENGPRRVPIIIGTPEAQSIAIFLEGLKPPRPLTHDLFTSVLDEMEIRLAGVSIYKYEDGVFFSYITFLDKEGNFHQLDSRASDAIALAIRNKAPITTTEEIMQKVSIVAEDNIIFQEDFENIEDPLESGSYENMSIEELKSAMEDAIKAEDYEKASNIRDIINKKA